MSSVDLSSYANIATNTIPTQPNITINIYGGPGPQEEPWSTSGSSSSGTVSSLPPCPPMPVDSSSTSTVSTSSSSAPTQAQFQALENYYYEQDILQAEEGIAASQLSQSSNYGSSGYDSSDLDYGNEYGYNPYASSSTSSSSANLTSEIELLAMLLEEAGTQGGGV